MTSEKPSDDIVKNKLKDEIEPFIFRELQRDDNPHIARIIRDTLTELDVVKPGTVYFDPTTDDLYTLFSNSKSHYTVVEIDGVVVGGGGIFPTEDLPNDMCELVKVYLIPTARGKGIGKRLILYCLEKARNMGFNAVYLESLKEQHFAVRLYESIGFKHLDAPLGQSGHFACSFWMLKTLT